EEMDDGSSRRSDGRGAGARPECGSPVAADGVIGAGRDVMRGQGSAALLAVSEDQASGPLAVALERQRRGGIRDHVADQVGAAGGLGETAGAAREGDGYLSHTRRQLPGG